MSGDMNALISALMVLLPLAVAGILLTGLLGFAQGGPWYRRHAHTLMRLRVGLQLAAVVLLLALAALR